MKEWVVPSLNVPQKFLGLINDFKNFFPFVKVLEWRNFKGKMGKKIKEGDQLGGFLKKF